jgi:hypothetical protein
MQPVQAHAESTHHTRPSTRAGDIVTGAYGATDIMEGGGALAMDHAIIPMPVRPWTLNGLSERLIVSQAAVGCNVTRALRERGFDARYVRGGLSAWYAAGGARAMQPAGK